MNSFFFPSSLSFSTPASSRSRFLKGFFGMLLGSAISLGADTLPDKVANSAGADDVEAPAVLAVTVPANGSYLAGAVLSFTLHLSENVLVDAGGGTPGLALKVGDDTVFASYASGTGTNALIFNYTVQAGNNATDGIELPTSLSPNGGTLRDAAGNNLSVALNGAAATTGVIVDTIRPVAIEMVRLDANPTNASSVRYAITFSEPVTGLNTNDFGSMTGGVGMSGGLVWVSKITQTSPTSFELVVSGLKGTGIMHIFLAPWASVYDVAGNLLTAGISSPNYDVDRVSPVVTRVAVPKGATYIAKQTLDFTVNFNEPVIVNTMGGIPRIAIELNHGGIAFANYFSGSGTPALVFRMIVASGQADIDGIAVVPAIDPAGGSIGDAPGNAINPALNSVASTTGVRVDAVPPAVVGSGIPNQSLTIGMPAGIISLLPHFTDIGSTSMTYTVTANSASSRAAATISGNNLTLSPLANGVTNITVQANDGHGGTVSDTFEVAVGTATPTPLQIGSTATLNRQNGLFEMTVDVTNTTARPINGFRLYVDYSAYKTAHPSLRLYNASSVPGNSKDSIDYPFPVAVDAVVSMQLSFYTSTRTFPSPFAPTLTVEALPTSQVTDTNGQGVQPRLIRLADNNILLEFPAVVGRWYRVRFSNDMLHWQDCPVPIKAGTTRMQWIDSGPPFTDVTPAQATSRFYRVNEITAP